jgi:hypothetical protein
MALDDAPYATLVFDGRPPLGLDLDEHFSGKLRPENVARNADGKDTVKNFEDHIVALADFAPGFRVVVLGETFGQYFVTYCAGFKASPSARRGPRIEALGTWRGYDVFVDHEHPPLQGYLAARVSSRYLGCMQLLDPLRTE